MGYFDEGETEIIGEGYISKQFYVGFYYNDEGDIKNTIIKSYNNNYPNREIKNKKINSCIWYNDEILFYSISNEGIYKYNCTTGETTTITEENREYNIKKIEDGYLYFDDAKVKI